jgi:hypothetical protein
MPNFFIGYVATRQPESAEQGAAEQQQWKAWLEGLGDAVVNPGTPLMNWSVSPAGANPELSSLTGYTVVTADDMKAALDMVRDCPFLKMGNVEVAQMMQM